MKPVSGNHVFEGSHSLSVGVSSGSNIVKISIDE